MLIRTHLRVHFCTQIADRCRGTESQTFHIKLFSNSKDYDDPSKKYAKTPSVHQQKNTRWSKDKRSEDSRAKPCTTLRRELIARVMPTGSAHFNSAMPETKGFWSVPISTRIVWVAGMYKYKRERCLPVKNTQFSRGNPPQSHPDIK